MEMKKLSAVLMVILVVALIPSNALAIEYNTDVSPELTVEVGDCFFMDIWLDDVPEPLITAGFFIVQDPSLANIIDVAVYDGELNPDIWDPGSTYKVPDADGPGTYMLAVLQFSTVSPDDVKIGQAEICAIAEGVNTITISTVPGFQTVVALTDEIVVYDPEIVPHSITVNQILPPCRCEITGDTYIFSNPFQTVTEQYDVSSDQNCTNPSEYVWSDTCIKGDVDQNGLMTLPPSYYGESCELCVTDTANTDINTGELVQCCLPIEIEGYPPDTDGDGCFDPYDNCPEIPNGFLEGTCASGTVGESCNDHEDCGIEGYCSMDQENTDGDGLGDVCDNCPNNYNPTQEDNYPPPPSSNGIGDACDCEGNFDCDEDEDGADAATFKIDFGRSAFDNPCEGDDPCNGDFDCDGDCDGTDAALFKQDFGRSSFDNPCPVCVVGEWCSY
jgi:hypothetical protein